MSVGAKMVVSGPYAGVTKKKTGVFRFGKLHVLMLAARRPKPFREVITSVQHAHG